jgi:hypothetical protein
MSTTIKERRPAMFAFLNDKTLSGPSAKGENIPIGMAGLWRLLSRRKMITGIWKISL